MLTLYYSPGACSLAPHIALEETGASYALQLASIAKGEQQASEYLNVDPGDKIPALRTNQGVLTENVAILTYIASSFPQARLLPEEPIGLARCISHMAYLSNTVHPAFTHIVRPSRFATDLSAQENVKAIGRENVWKLLQELDGLLDDQQWVLGSRYSVADPYTLAFTVGAKGTACRSNCSRIIPPLRTVCCNARGFGRCSNTRRAGCSTADQIGR
jgi:glutathione S-transferase